ncbi:MAG: thermonuclease family protein [Planctomycetes bacterium]|nr:thermonuclease family protein [Planctomycetota bacterium]
MLPAVFLSLAQAVVLAAPSPDRVTLRGGATYELYGLSAPAGPVDLNATLELCAGEWSLELLDEWRVREGDAHLQDKGAWLARDGRALNLELVRAGLALVEPTGFSDAHLLELVAAAREAQRAGAGLWASARKPAPSLDATNPAPVGPAEFRLAPPGPIAGVALPLHDKQSYRSYEPALREIRALGAQWVNLIVATRQDTSSSNSVPLGSDRTPPDWRVVETIRQARELGLEVLVIPIVLIRNSKPDEWRGVLKPADRAAWWRSYQRHLLHTADLAREGGASALAIGSELLSLENEPAPWRRVALAVRARFPGWLTYSANWDHFAKIEFWDALDFASMTAYFTLASGEDPSLFEVRTGWAKALAEVRRLGEVSKLPAVISEVGVPSQTGGLQAPWDYTRNRAVDLEAQRLGFEAFRDVFTPDGAPAAGFHGAFLYDWWGEGGPTSMEYSARGKPAEALWREILHSLSPARTDR